MAIKLDDAKVKKLPPPAKGLRVFSDTVLRGFGVRVLPSGSRSYVLSFTGEDGKRSLTTIAPFLGLGSGETQNARERAEKLAFEIKHQGHDPVVAKAKRRREAEEAWTIDKLCDEFEASRKRRNKKGDLRYSSMREYAPHIARMRAKFGKRKIDSISKDDLQTYHDEQTDKYGPASGNTALRVASGMFTLAMEREKLTTNPASAKKVKRNKQPDRDRVLDEAERKAVMLAGDRIGYPYGTIAKMLLFLGQRQAEVSAMRWSELNMPAALWVLPPERVKNGKRHEVPLAKPVLEILASLAKEKDQDQDLVFTTTGDVPPNGFGKAIKRVHRASATRGWTWHDLRRTTATGLAELRTPSDVTEHILNHVSESLAGVARIYARHDYAKAKREALTAWANYLVGLVEGRPSNVVDLETRQANV